MPDGVRVDSGVETGSVVVRHYDAMLAKVIAHAPTRERGRAGSPTRSPAPGCTASPPTATCSSGCCARDAWRDGEVDTGHLDRADAAALGAPLLPRRAACTRWPRRSPARPPRRAAATCLGGLPDAAGATSRRSRSAPCFDGIVVEHALDPRRPDRLAVDGAALTGVRLWSAPPELVDLEVDGVRRRYRVALERRDRLGRQPARRQRATSRTPRFPLPGSALAAGSLTAPMPGTVLRVDVEAGAAVEEGQVLLVLEAMKMEHAVRAPVGRDRRRGGRRGGDAGRRGGRPRGRRGRVTR